MILTLRTDKPEAEIGLFDGTEQLTYLTWYAHRQLAETIHAKIKDLLAGQSKDLADLTGIVIYQGPGSFTGLRIGISVANALSYALAIPEAGATGEDWVREGSQNLQNNSVMPEYGAPVHITPPKK
jgi:tRNA threonylcarbamoyladenosine biosynthesis protein TsaB